MRTPTDVLTAFAGRRIIFLGDDTVSLEGRGRKVDFNYRVTIF